MGGLGPGIGGFELVIIAIGALIVIGPKDLPLMMRRVGKMMAKARGMANELRASFDEMARQSELDDLRKEVEALRRGQGMHPLGAEAEAAFRDINRDLNRPLDAPAPILTGPEEWPQADAVSPAEPAAAPAPTGDPAADPTPAKPAKPRKAATSKAASAEPTARKTTAAGKTGKPAASRKKKVDL